MTPREQIDIWVSDKRRVYGGSALAVRVVRAALGIIDRAHWPIESMPGHCRCRRSWEPADFAQCPSKTFDEAALWKAIGGQE